MPRFFLNKIKKNLKQSRVNKTEKPSFIESSTIQQLLSQQSEVAKKNIMKKSVDNMIEKNQIHNEIELLKKKKCYRGVRHFQKLPVRGQRTSTNSRTARKKL